MKAFYQLSVEDSLSQLKSGTTGLPREAVPGLLQKHGKNVLKEARRKTKLSILLSQFADIMILILVIAAIISFVSGEKTDAFVILAIIIANAWIGYSQEYNAEESVRMLQKMAAQFATVLRSNNPEKIGTAELVPGDLLMLEAGDIVPADARLIEISSFKTDEASLTGESYAVEKNINPIADENIVPGDQHNMVFKGTIVTSGTAKAVVTVTGMNTELGKIAGMMEVEPQKTPLQKRLAAFSKQLAVIVIAICGLVFAFGIWQGEDTFSMFLTALSLAVAALPEALPAVITIALAQGANRMVKRKALIRKLPAVETLGSVTYICSDKTGTLTQNVMTVEKLEPAEDKEDLLLDAMLLNNEVKISDDKQLLGDSTETALVKYAIEKGKTKADADSRYPLAKKLPFDSERMRMSTLHSYEGKSILFVKGAPGKVAETLSEKYKEQVPALLEKNKAWAAEGWRVLFFAYKILDHGPAELEPGVESGLEFLGMVAMIDPPREEVIQAIRECNTAGIKTVMITGDQLLTASAIATRLGMLSKDTAEVIAGADLEKMSEDDLKETTKNTSVYARVSPAQKLAIVKSLQANGEFVAMTGDGVNDAPSLKQADIGVAMGITGTDVTKEASDMILLDDNFATIVNAVREGRRIYENIRKFIVYVLSCNLGEILTIFIASLLGFGIPLLPIHILWINLVTDGLPGLALVGEPAEKDIMQRPPRSPKENLFAGGLVLQIIMTGAVMAGAALFIQWYTQQQGYDTGIQQTAVFSVLCFVQLGNALAVRSLHHSIFYPGLFANKAMWGAILLTVFLQAAILYIPFLQPIFKTTSLSLQLITIVCGVTIICIVLIELLKLAGRSNQGTSSSGE